MHSYTHMSVLFTFMCRVPPSSECDQQFQVVFIKCSGSAIKYTQQSCSENACLVNISGWVIFDTVHMKELSIRTCSSCHAYNLHLTVLQSTNSFAAFAYFWMKLHVCNSTSTKMGIRKFQLEQHSTNHKCKNFLCHQRLFIFLLFKF